MKLVDWLVLLIRALGVFLFWKALAAAIDLHTFYHVGMATQTEDAPHPVDPTLPLIYPQPIGTFGPKLIDMMWKHVIYAFIMGCILLWFSVPFARRLEKFLIHQSR